MLGVKSVGEFPRGWMKFSRQRTWYTRISRPSTAEGKHGEEVRITGCRSPVPMFYELSEESIWAFGECTSAATRVTQGDASEWINNESQGRWSYSSVFSDSRLDPNIPQILKIWVLELCRVINLLSLLIATYSAFGKYWIYYKLSAKEHFEWLCSLSLSRCEVPKEVLQINRKSMTRQRLTSGGISSE